MKIALCLYGVVGGVEGKASYSKSSSDKVFKIGYEHYKKYFLDKYNIDVFVHTWSVNYKNNIIKYYNPKKFLFQKQKEFEIPSYVEISQEYKERDSNRIQNHYSRWYSTKKVIDLKKQYEEENNFTYNFVLITRFDVAFFKSIKFEKLKTDFFYAAPWCYNINIIGRKVPNANFYSWKKKYPFPFSITIHRHRKFPHNDGLADLWFVSNSDFMDKFSLLYDNLDKYLKDIEVSNHKLAEFHLSRLGLICKIIFIRHRFRDFEVIRRKFFNSNK